MGTLGALYVLLTESELVHANTGAKLIGVRIWPSEDYTRITLESDKALSISHQLLTTPDRLVVDIDGLKLNPTLKDLVVKVKPNDPYVAHIRAGQFQPTIVRLVFDLKEAVKPQLFTLNPVGEYRYRLIFDLYPTNPPDPLMRVANKRGFNKNRGNIRRFEDCKIGLLDPILMQGRKTADIFKDGATHFKGVVNLRSG